MTRRSALVVGAASIVFACFALHEAWVDAPTYDEPTYVSSALVTWTRHDLHVNRQTAPLAKQLAALPVLLLHPTIPTVGSKSEHQVAQSFVRAEIRRGELQKVFFVARLLPILEGIAVGWVIALLARRLFGPGAEVLPALLWLLNPFAIGLSHLDGIDVPFALSLLVTSLAIAWARERPSWRRCALVGACAGITVLTRLTGVLVVPVAALAVAMAPGEGRVRRGAIAVGVSWLTLAVAYAALAPTAAVSGVAGTLVNLAVPLDWRRGAVHLLHAGSRPGPAFVLGHFHMGRWLFFWPASLLVKLPPLTLVALVATPLAWLRLDAGVRREAWWVIGLPAVVLGVFTLQQQRPIGLRYLLASIVLWMIGSGAVATMLRSRVRQAATIAVAAGGLVAASSGHALAWTSPLVGPGHDVVADSNLDWGQGFYDLQAWAKGKHPRVSYFGGAGLDVVQIPGATALGRGPDGVDGWVAVSVSDLVAYRRRDLAWLRDRCPDAVLADTILVYDMRTRASTPGCGQVSGSGSPTRLNTRVTPRSRTS
jgi:hypothetical protein